jgi:hypothetical protein
MSDVSVWRFFAYMDGDEDHRNDERRTISDWQVLDVIRWATTRGYDHIYLSRAGTSRFEKAPSSGVVHQLYPRSCRGSHEFEEGRGGTPA